MSDVQTAYIHSVETLGTLDGPGIRYVVFFAGCPLRCIYCHNPDTQNINDGKETDLDTLVRDICGYRNFIKSGGVTLSGGQKQRVAIARMLVEHTPVMIFDDSLSAVDAQTDAMIREALKKRMAGTTVILIAHRITTLMQADCIMVLEDGAVAEMGSHEQLMEHHGIYRRIYDIQMNTQLDADSV